MPQTLNKVHEPLMKDEQYSAWNAVSDAIEGGHWKQNVGVRTILEFCI